MKTEPSVFSFDDLLRAPNRTTGWEGVRNYQARNLMRDQFRVGDQVLIYHSSIEEPVVIGVAEVVRGAYPDVTAMDSKHKYFDPRVKGTTPWVQVDVKAIAGFRVPVTRSMMRSQPTLKSIMVLKKGARLSVQPVSPQEFECICKLGKKNTHPS